MNTLKNICFIIVVSGIIASNPKLLITITSLFTRVVYNSSVMVVEVVGEAAKKANESQGKDFLKPVPSKAPKKVVEVKEKTKAKASEYSKWMKAEMEKLSSGSSPKSTSSTK